MQLLYLPCEGLISMPLTIPPSENEDRYYLGSEEISLVNNDNKEILRQRLRQYLNLRNVSILIGNGPSISLGAPIINNIKSFMECTNDNYCTPIEKDQYEQNIELLNFLISSKKEISLEDFLGCLYNIISYIDTLDHDVKIMDKEIKKDSVLSLINTIKRKLYYSCSKILDEIDINLLRNHKELFRRFLLRPLSLPRIKIFTTNYDLIIENALDDLGVYYIDGFIGSVHRTLRSEAYNYDLYFPGDTTEGRVSRVDRVVQFYKLHGSINWRKKINYLRSEIFIKNTTPENSKYEEVMIYPSPLKYNEMQGYPYSEMFRHFSSQIHQPQSVLFSIGYSFGDVHINRIIYQALSIPSFALVIVVPELSDEIKRIKDQVNSKRILIITGGKLEKKVGFVSGAGTIQDYSTIWMPDIEEMDIESKVDEEVKRLYEKKQNEEQ